MTDFAVSPSRLRSMASTHEGAADDLNALAPSRPSGVDGGEGTPHILLMLADLGADAQDLAQLNHGTGSVLRHVAGNTETTDAEAAALLRMAPADGGGS